MIDITNYFEKKEKGLLELVKAGGGYAIAIKKFNPENGDELSPEIIAVDTDELTKRREALEKEITDIDKVLADIKSVA